MKKITSQAGFSVIEFLLAIVIASIVGFVVVIFARNVINLNASAQASMTALLESRKILSVMIAEFRSAIPSALGAYPIESASTSTVIFFADANSDEIADRIRYFFDPLSRSVQRGVILATDNPPAYTETEVFSTLITDVVNSASTPLFDYYDENYDGTSPPLSEPINIADIRLVKVTVQIDKDPNREPASTTLTSQATLRNLKDNI